MKLNPTALVFYALLAVGALVTGSVWWIIAGLAGLVLDATVLRWIR